MASNSKNKKTPHNKSKIRFEKFLKAIDSTWGRVIVIGLIFVAGFNAGCYYKETVVTRKYMEYDIQREDYWRDKIEEFQIKLSTKDEIIYNLREHNMQLLHSSDSILMNFNPLQNYE